MCVIDVHEWQYGISTILFLRHDHGRQIPWALSIRWQETHCTSHFAVLASLYSLLW